MTDTDWLTTDRERCEADLLADLTALSGPDGTNDEVAVHELWVEDCRFLWRLDSGNRIRDYAAPFLQLWIYPPMPFDGGCEPAWVPAWLGNAKAFVADDHPAVLGLAVAVWRAIAWNDELLAAEAHKAWLGWKAEIETEDA